VLSPSTPSITRLNIYQQEAVCSLVHYIARCAGFLLVLLASYSYVYAIESCRSESDVGNKFPSNNFPGMCRTFDLKDGTLTCQPDGKDPDGRERFSIKCVANPTTSPPVPPNADSVSLRNFEVTQTIQNYANDVTLIAEKTTWVRAYLALNKTSGARGVTAQLQATLEDGSLVTLPPEPPSSSVTITASDTITSQRVNWQRSLNYLLPFSATRAGRVTFRLVSVRQIDTPK
jgi:hypothetical protein